MKIGELAKKTGCLVETIRYYESEGLLSAPQRDPLNNYRRYNNSHLDRLMFIRRCRALDMTHEEIRALLDARRDPDASCESINTLINTHLFHVQEKIIELQFLEKQLEELKNSCNVAKMTRDCGILHELTHSSDHIQFSNTLSVNHVKLSCCKKNTQNN